MEHCTQCKAQIRCFFEGLFVKIVTVQKHMKTDRSHLFPDGVSYIARCKDLSNFYFIAIWVHLHSSHIRGFEQSFLATGEHGFVEPITLGSSITRRIENQENGNVEMAAR